MNIKKQLTCIVDEISYKTGFNLYNGKRIKEYTWGFDSLTNSQLILNNSNNTFRLFIFLNRRINILETFWEDFYRDIGINYDDIKQLMTLSLKPEINAQDVKNFPEYFHEINESGVWSEKDLKISEKGFEQFREKANFLMNFKLIPQGEKLKDLEKLDQILNNKASFDNNISSSIFNKNGFEFRRLILARLTGNPWFEDIYNNIKSNYPLYIQTSKRPGLEYFANLPTVFEKVYSRLKEVQPLDNPILD